MDVFAMLDDFFMSNFLIIGASFDASISARKMMDINVKFRLDNRNKAKSHGFDPPINDSITDGMPPLAGRWR